MLSQYTWSQFFLFVGILVGLYYLVVGLLYYRDEFFAILKGRQVAGAQRARAGAGDSPAAPALVRSKSAFVVPATTTQSGADAAPATTAAPAGGAADNLPEAVAVVGGGKLPDSTATATGRNDSPDAPGPMAAAAAVTGAAQEALTLDADREEQIDQPDEALAARIRQKLREMQSDESASTSAEEASPAESIAKNNTNGANIETARILVSEITVELENGYRPDVATSHEPLADFSLPIASISDVTPVTEDELTGAEAVADYILQLRAGDQPPVPAALIGTSLADHHAHYTSVSAAELTQLFGADAD